MAADGHGRSQQLEHTHTLTHTHTHSHTHSSLTVPLAAILTNAQLAKVDVFLEALHVTWVKDEVDGEVQFLQALDAFQILNDLDVVEGEVDVFEALEAVQVLNLANDVVLQVQDLEIATRQVQQLNPEHKQHHAAAPCNSTMPQDKTHIQ